MAIELTHQFRSPKRDGDDATLIQPSDWNDTHTITMSGAALIGRESGTGEAQEIGLSSNMTIVGGQLATTLETNLATSSGASNVGFIQTGSNPIPRTSEAKMRDVVAVADFETPAHADANGVTLFTAADTASTVANGASLSSTYWGPGQIETANGNKRGKWFSNVTAAPASVGDHDSVETAFNGDLSRSIFQVEHRITGASTLGTPASGYLYTPEAYPFYGVLYNSSGHNEETGGNDGRTGAAFMRVGIKQYGQGDLACYNASAFVTGTKVGSTSFLANPAAVLFNGDMTAGEDGVYLNSLEFILRDNGYDVAGLGPVINMVRTDATGAKGAWWGAFRAQNQGTVAPDNVLSAAGEWNTGLDFSMTDFGANEAAVALAPGQRIYGEASSSNGNYATAFGDSWIEYSNGLAAWNIVAGNNSALQIGAAKVVLAVPPQHVPITASGLPSAASNTGMEYYITDCNSTTRLAVAAGGGSNFVKVFSNGTNWLIA